REAPAGDAADVVLTMLLLEHCALDRRSRARLGVQILPLTIELSEPSRPQEGSVEPVLVALRADHPHLKVVPGESESMQLHAADALTGEPGPPARELDDAPRLTNTAKSGSRKLQSIRPPLLRELGVDPVPDPGRSPQRRICASD